MPIEDKSLHEKLRKRCRQREVRRAKRLGEAIDEGRIQQCVARELEKEKLRGSQKQADLERLRALEQSEDSILDESILRRLSRVNRGLRNPSFESEQKEREAEILREFEKSVKPNICPNCRIKPCRCGKDES